MSGAERQQRYLQRKAKQRGVLNPECDLAGIADLLHAEGYLDDWRNKTRAELSCALTKYLDDYLRVTGHSGDAW
jgi:hypothetical protein